MNTTNVDPNILITKHDVSVDQKIQEYSHTISQLVALGTHMIAAIARNATQNHTNDKVVVLVMLRRIIEQLDAAFVEIQSGVVLPTANNLRGIIDAYLQFKYLLMTPNLVADKSENYMYAELQNDIDIRTQTIEDIENEGSSSVYYSELPDLKSMRDSDIQQTQQPYFALSHSAFAAKAYESNGRRKNVTIQWFFLSSNANNTRFLAKNVGEMDMYLMLYTTTSNIIHSSRLLRDTLIEDAGIVSVRPIRDVSSLDDLSNGLIKIAIRAMNMAVPYLLDPDAFLYYGVANRFNIEYAGKYRLEYPTRP